MNIQQRYQILAIYSSEIAAMIKVFRSGKSVSRSNLIMQFTAKFGKTNTLRIIEIAEDHFGLGESVLREQILLPDEILDIVFERTRAEWEVEEQT